MGHLVKPILAQDTEPIALGAVLKDVRAAHDFLVMHGVQAIEKAQSTSELRHWGSNIKRLRVRLSEVGRPQLISKEEENLTEVYNQCATMERLLDALEWANKAMPEYGVVRCHPTTSSQKGHRIRTSG